MKIETAQIVHSAQVWVCNACGSHDPKSCGCNSAAHMEELRAKNRAYVTASRGKSRAKSNSNVSLTDPIESAEESEIKKAEAELCSTELQNIMFDRVCRIIAEMTPRTLSRFKRYWEENYGQD